MPALSHLAETSEDLGLPAKFPDDIEGVQNHLKQLLEGEAFRGSNRSGQFLKYLIDETVAGRQENLKERFLGIEIFNRAPAYDTGGDAIVRVTASDVRKRLQHHYALPSICPSFRFSLPPGSYVPKITRHKAPSSQAGLESVPDGTTLENFIPETAVAEVPASSGTQRKQNASIWRWVAIALMGSSLGFVAALVQRANTRDPLLSMLPWSELLSNSNPTLLITSDPNIAEIQGFTRSPISLSDYANHRYVSHPELLTPDELRFCNVILRGDKASNVDGPIIASVSAVAVGRSKSILVKGARSTQLSELQGDKNLILLGSLRSNPWIGLFMNHLDFRFEFEASSFQEIIRDVHPRAGEASTYVATAPGWATGESFALIAFFQNPDGNGHVLLLGGENGEGTEAAGKLVADPRRLSATLAKCGISAKDRDRNFEVLLRLNTLAGSPSNVDAIACRAM